MKFNCPYAWYQARFENYRNKLHLTKQKAWTLLMRVGTGERLRREFDRIVDSPFWSSKEPGISFEERQRRRGNLYKPLPEKPKQLRLF